MKYDENKRNSRLYYQKLKNISFASINKKFSLCFTENLIKNLFLKTKYIKNKNYYIQLEKFLFYILITKKLYRVMQKNYKEIDDLFIHGF